MQVWREAERLLGVLSPPLDDADADDAGGGEEEEEDGWDIVGYEEAGARGMGEHRRRP